MARLSAPSDFRLCPARHLEEAADRDLPVAVGSDHLPDLRVAQVGTGLPGFGDPLRHQAHRGTAHPNGVDGPQGVEVLKHALVALAPGHLLDDNSLGNAQGGGHLVENHVNHVEPPLAAQELEQGLGEGSHLEVGGNLAGLRGHLVPNQIGAEVSPFRGRRLVDRVLSRQGLEVGSSLQEGMNRVRQGLLMQHDGAQPQGPVAPGGAMVRLHFLRGDRHSPGDVIAIVQLAQVPALELLQIVLHLGVRLEPGVQRGPQQQLLVDQALQKLAAPLVGRLAFLHALRDALGEGAKLGEGDRISSDGGQDGLIRIGAASNQGSDNGECSRRQERVSHLSSPA